MRKPWIAAALVAAFATTAQAGFVDIPNGNFEDDGQPPGSYTQAVSNWTISFNQTTPTAPNSPPVNHQSGIFTSFSGFSPTSGDNFVMLSNLGLGTITMAGTTPFLVDDRNIEFRYVFGTNDPPGSQGDQFFVTLDIYSDPGGANLTSSTTLLVADTATVQSTLGASPFGGGGAPITYARNGSHGSPFTLFKIDTTGFIGSYARLSFVVNNNGPAAGTNNNGLGVSGVLIDGIILSPEPGTLALFGLGVLGLGGVVMRRRKLRGVETPA